jgi:hypothetical protein
MEKHYVSQTISLPARELAATECRTRDGRRDSLPFVEAFKVGGGALAAMKPGSRFIVEQDRVNDGIWLPIYEEARVSARAMLVAGFDIKQKFTYGDYRRFDGASGGNSKSQAANK